ncbi:hypothetical protein [Ornithinibacillus californiensis]|uniref:hypothetical protein n=1 Tax=Ornithinibacillus californiensis TaxID=161536 RepID=UPI00064DFB07|nr:hypothetical protein [Ornithinibacillus californiensis]
MFRRKLITVLLGSLLGITGVVLALYEEEYTYQSFLVMIGDVFSIISFIFPILILYGGGVTLLSDYLTSRFLERRRFWMAFLIHTGFGALFGIVIQDGSHVSILGLEVDSMILAAIIASFFFWMIDELLRTKEVNKRTLFIIGVSLLIITLPFTTLMIMDEVKSEQMTKRFTVTKHFHTYPPPQPVYTIGGNKIAITEEIPNDSESYIDPWQNKVMLGDITVFLNDEVLATLEDYPIRAEWEGLARYHGQLSFLLMKDHQMEEERLVVLLKDTRETPKRKNDNNIEGKADLEDLQYTYYELDEAGNVKKDSFYFTERSHYEIFLLHRSSLAPYGTLRYYSENFHSPGIPAFSIIGGLLVVFNWRIRKKV